MKTLSLSLSQLRYVNKAFWRNPTSAFFTFAFPLMFLVVFTSLLGQYKVHLVGRTIQSSTYYVAAMAAYALISACYNNIAIGVTVQRDSGVLKRINVTPLPAPSYFIARVLHALFVAVLLVAITVGFGASLYHASVPGGATLARLIVVILVGAAAFSALGFAITSFIANAEAAPAVVNASIMPLLFLSGIFIPLGKNAPAWILWVAKVFPVRHFALGMQAGFLGTAFSWNDVVIVALWGVAGLVIATRRFVWEPRV